MERTTRQTLSEAFEGFKLFAHIEGRKARTMEVYETAVGDLIGFVGDKPVEEVATGDVRRWMASKLDQGYAKTSVSIWFRSIRAFFNWLVAEGYLSENPTKLIRQPRQPWQFPYVLTEQQVRGLLKAAQARRKSWTGKRNWAMVLTMLDGMLRLSELKSLELDELSLQSRSLRIIEGKGDKDRVVPMGRRLTRAIRDWLQVRGEPIGEDRVFITQGEYGLDSRNVQRIVKRLGESANLSEVRCSPHTLRHTGATLYIKNGGDPFSLQQILGHSDISTTMIYVHMAGSALHEAHAKASPVDRLLSG